MNNHSIVNLKCPCFLFRYSNLDIPSQALFNLHRTSALPLWCGSEEDQNFQSPLGHSRRPVRWRRYCIVLVCHSEDWYCILTYSSGLWWYGFPCHMSHVTGHMTHVTCHHDGLYETTLVTRSHVICHMSHIICHMTHIPQMDSVILGELPKQSIE